MFQELMTDMDVISPEDLNFFDHPKKSNLLNLLPSAVYICNHSGKITYFNDIAVKLWGYTPDLNDADLKYCACFKVYLPDGSLIKPDETPMAETLRTGKSFRNLEVLVGKPDGSSFYASVNIAPFFNPQGKVMGAINVFQDISETKASELAVKKSEERYKQLLENIQAPVYTTDENGRITLYNKAAAELWGREPELGKDMWSGSLKILKPDGSDLPLDECPMAVALKEKRPVVGEEILVVRPDGTVRNVTPHPQPLFDELGNITGAINLLVDITDFKQSRNALKESENRIRILNNSLEEEVQKKTKELEKKNEDLKKSEERYHKMIEEVEDYAIILLDKDGIVQNWNKGAEKIKGYKESEIVGESFQKFYPKHDRESGLPIKLINEARETGKAIHEGWRMRKDGTMFWGSIVLTALHDSENNILGFSKVTRDLTERKLAEDQLKNYTNELEFQNQELEQFAYAASHDMKEPLRKIHFYNSFIAENSSGELNPKSKDYLDRSIKAVKRITDLINDLLSYSRTTSNLDNYEDIDSNEIVEEIILEHKEVFDNKKVSIVLDHLPNIRFVPFQFKQLMNNLINNAIKYKHPDRDIVIKISSERISGSSVKHKDILTSLNYNKFSVEDNGLGFEPQYAEKIFEIFQRLNNAIGAKGSGIGLSICKKIVQNHKGIILASAKPGEGARFDFYIPENL